MKPENKSILQYTVGFVFGAAMVFIIQEDGILSWPVVWCVILGSLVSTWIHFRV